MDHRKKSLLWLYPLFTTVHHVYGAVWERKVASLHLEIQLPLWEQAGRAWALALNRGKQHTAAQWGENQVLQEQPSWVPAVHTVFRLQDMGSNQVGAAVMPGTPLQCCGAAEAFHILHLQHWMSARAGNHGHGPGTQPVLCGSPDFPVTPEPW